MKVFDLHSDILTDITNKRALGQTNVFKNEHLIKLEEGGISGAILVIWVEPEHSNHCRARTLDILQSTSYMLHHSQDAVLKVLRYEDLQKSHEEKKFSALLGLEGMSSIQEDLDLLYVFYQYGIRHGSLTWNEENALATGVGGNPNRGLTKAGIKAIHIMENLGILLDVSHLNERSFWDVYQCASKPFIASHSNAYSLCPHPRNLKDNQLKAIAQCGGIIGINAWPEFVDHKHPTIEKLVHHIDYIVQLVGIDSVAFGFDFCDFLDETALSSFSTGEGIIHGLKDASQVSNLIEALKGRGYKNTDLEKIAYKNSYRILHSIL